MQTVLVQKIHGIDRSHIDPLRPVLLEILGEALKTEVHGVSSTYSSVTLSQGSALPSDALERMRAQAIEATRTPNGSRYANELLVTILENSARIIDFFSNVALTESYEMLQTIEKKALRLYERNQGIGALGPDAAVQQARDALDASIIRFRDTANANKGFTIYKTLVGFESVFPPAWDDSNFGYEEEAAYRTERIAEFVAEVDEANAEEWFAIMRRCAQTDSDDLSTFPAFGQFLQKLSQAKPLVVLGFVTGSISA
jgi:hypothetical protein